MDKLSNSVRPILTYIAFTVYITTSTVGLFLGKLDYAIYFSQIGTMVGMMVSHYFATETALTDPNTKKSSPK